MQLELREHTGSPTFLTNAALKQLNSLSGLVKVIEYNINTLYKFDHASFSLNTFISEISRIRRTGFGIDGFFNL